MVNGSKIKNYDYFLWERFKSGDEKAFEEIYKDHYQSLYNYGYRIYPKPEFVKEVIQELFYDIISSIKNLGETDNIRFYLIASVRRKMMVSLKKQSRYIHPDTGENHFEFDFDVSAEESIIQKEENNSHQLQIKKLMSNLSARQKEAIFLKFYNNMSYEEIMKIMDINYQSARTLIYKAIKVMRKLGKDESALVKVRMQ